MNNPHATADSARMTLAQISAACADGLPLPPSGARGSPFAEPWQAQAFAMTVLLHQRGVFSWPEWAAALTAQIRSAQASGDADDGSTYYQHWLDALEQMVIERGLGTPEQIHELEHAWEDAAERTPHGQPIVLANPPMR
ncbi:MAG: nitrile hydratase accessory protein [Burkholderiaceae bacterium]